MFIFSSSPRILSLNSYMSPVDTIGFQLRQTSVKQTHTFMGISVSWGTHWAEGFVSDGGRGNKVYPKKVAITLFKTRMVCGHVSGIYYFYLTSKDCWILSLIVINSEWGHQAKKVQDILVTGIQLPTANPSPNPHPQIGRICLGLASGRQHYPRKYLWVLRQSPSFNLNCCFLFSSRIIYCYC